MNDYVVNFETLGMDDVERVGGKNASLGEMIQNLSKAGVDVPGGYATTAHAYREFLAHEGLADRIHDTLEKLDVEDLDQLAATGAQIRKWVIDTPFPAKLEAAIRQHFDVLADGHDIAVAVRSSATAEDLPEASFAGQQESFLNVRGIDQVILRVKEVFASLYNDRAISYRVHQNFEHSLVALSAGIQRMVRSDIGASGVMFTLDTETGFRDAVFITASYGLGETVVQGSVNPDEFYCYKPALAANKRSIIRRNLGSKAITMIYGEDGHDVQTLPVDKALRNQFCLSDAEVENLARQAVIIENHYGRPMDIEWGKDGEDDQLYILQARPETVRSRQHAQVIERYTLQGKSKLITSGRSIGHKIGTGNARIIKDTSEMNRVQPGEVLITDMTDPDWEPVMKRASAIVTNRGGRTCHAAIIARELGIPAVVGCGDATEMVSEMQPVTVSCAEGDTGNVYDGVLDFDLSEHSLDKLPDVPVKIMMNVGNPDRAMDFASLPHEGVGLARLEFIINRMIGVHPRALLEFDSLDDSLKATITDQMSGYPDPIEFFIGRLSEGVSTIAAAFAPKPVIVRMSDFKSNEYANLIGGQKYEPHEENPMLGFRGASRYIDKSFRPCFDLECEAIKRVRNDMGLTNVQIMIPFVRTVDEARQVSAILADNDLARGTNGLKHIMMCELPSNALLADEFLEYFDGFSIGSNDLTQLTLGLDRDSGLVADLFDERDAAVKKLLSMAISACLRNNKYIGICGQGPSDHPDLAKWLLEQKIESMSLNPDTVIETRMFLAGMDID